MTREETAGLSRVLFSSGKDDWETPQDVFEKLDKEFNFTLDPCCVPETAKCEKYYTPIEDGLLQDWGGETAFVNPPYSSGQQDLWVKKCFEESRKPNTTVVALLPARTDTRRFHDYIYGKAEIRFIKGRIRFVGAGNSAPFPSMIAIWR
jgi:phage N-6-adenine-methyltransferase